MGYWWNFVITQSGGVLRCWGMLTEYDEQRHIASEKEPSREEGMKDGLEMGLKEGLKVWTSLKQCAINLLFKRGLV